MIFPENFKGHSFLKLDMGVPVKGLLSKYEEPKEINPFGFNVMGYDFRGVDNIKDLTLIDGEFQGEKYYEYRLGEIRQWLKTPRVFFNNKTCIINFRGGEYVNVPNLFLDEEYWNRAISMMLDAEPEMEFIVHTDDPITARQFFPNYTIIHDIEDNWQAIRYAYYMILSNSSFAILPALLNENNPYIIAPKYWAGHNKGYWQLKQNRYKKFNYI